MGLSNFKRVSLAFVFLCALAGGTIKAAGCTVGDVNKDGRVNVQDLLVLAQYWLDGACSNPECQADLDGVAGVNGADFALLAANWSSGPLVINEFMASNGSCLEDPDEAGEYPDWIELYNPGGNEVVDLGGMYLTDDLAEPTKWRIPEGVLIGPGEHLVFLADDDDEQGDLHTNFELDKAGDEIGLFDPNGVTLIDSIIFDRQAVDVSCGRYPSGDDEWRFSTTPTPEAANNGRYFGLVADTSFNPDRGFYDPNDAVVVTLSTETEGAEIYYTTNGSEPDPCNPDAVIYTGPIPVEGTTTLRAAAFKDNWLSTNVDTHTYVFIDEVITQSPNGEKPGPDWPDPYRGPDDQWIDYGMDPSVVNDPNYAELMDDALTSVPTISLVTDLNNLFNPSTDPNIGGIYTNATGRGEEWERPISMELINPDGSEGFQIDAGIRIRGGVSRWENNPKHAFRLFFRTAYGDAKLNFPLFGDEGVDRFDHIDLRCAQHYSWNFLLGAYCTQNRDVFSRDSQRDIGRPYTRSRYYHVYINGHYWGLYQSQERSEASYAESYFGGDKDDYDVIKVDVVAGRIIETADGNLEAYHRLWQEFDSGLASDSAYLRVQGLDAEGLPDPNYPVLLDVDNLIDYMIVIYYTGNRDSPIGPPSVDKFPNNFYAIYNRRAPDGFKYFAHDCEFTLEVNGGIYRDRTVAGTEPDLALKERFNPMSLHRELVGHPEYVMRFADRLHRHFFNDGALRPAAATARFMARANEIDLAIIAESARWGDAQTGDNPPYTKNDDWLPTINGIVNSYINHSPDTRTEIVLGQFKDRGWYPDIEAPVFSRHGGEVGAGFELTIINPAVSGEIYYTLDGSDPRLWGGAVNPAATRYGASVILYESTLIKARVRYGGDWSALTEAVFSIGPVKENLRITEIMYHPPDPNHEYVELKNIGSEAINLNWVSFDNGIDFTFPSIQLNPCEYTVVVKDPNQFEARYVTGANVAGAFGGSLDNGGEKIELVDAIGRVILDFDYSDDWFDMTDGAGFSLTVRDPNNADPNDWDDKKTWRPSAVVGGSPGWDDTGVIPQLGAVVINELLAHSHAAESDWIELYNTTSQAINIGGWFLSDSDTDDPNRKKYEIAAGTTIPLNGYVVFYEDQHFGDSNAPGCNATFALSENGETLYLRSGQNGLLTGYYEEEKFDASETNVAFGRYYKPSTDTYNFVAMSENTPGATNAYPKVGPVVITEIMYHPRDPNMGSPYTDDDDFEYVELYNITASAVTLQEYDNELEIDVGWRFVDEDASIDFVFPLGTTIPPGGCLLLVKDEDAFDYRYTAPGGVQVLEWGDGKCDNGGEKLELQMPGDMVAGERCYIRIDRVNYSDGSHPEGEDPWPSEPDGTGQSLHRIVPADYGNDVANWKAARPVPGL